MTPKSGWTSTAQAWNNAPGAIPATGLLLLGSQAACSLAKTHAAAAADTAGFSKMVRSGLHGLIQQETLRQKRRPGLIEKFLHDSADYRVAPYIQDARREFLLGLAVTTLLKKIDRGVSFRPSAMLRLVALLPPPPAGDAVSDVKYNRLGHGGFKTIGETYLVRSRSGEVPLSFS